MEARATHFYEANGKHVIEKILRDETETTQTFQTKGKTNAHSARNVILF